MADGPQFHPKPAGTVGATPATPATRATPGAPAAPEVRAAQAGDRLAIAAERPAVEADVRLLMKGDTAVQADGKVAVRRAYIERLSKQLLQARGPYDDGPFRDLVIGFDPAMRRYTVEGKAKWHGITLPTAITARPVMVGDQIGIQLEAPQLRMGKIRMGVPFMGDVARDMVIKELRGSMVSAREGDRPGLVLVDPTSLLHMLGVMPAYMRLDGARTRMHLGLEASGDLALTLRAADQAALPPAPPATPRSDVAVAVDEAALKALLAQALAPDYELSGVTLRDGGAALSGQADLKPVSAGLTLMRDLLIVASYGATRGRTPPGVDTRDITVRAKMGVDVALEGRTMVITPEIKRACPEIVKMLAVSKLEGEARDGKVYVDLDRAAAGFGADLERLKLDAHGASLRAGVDMGKLLGDAPV